MKFYGTFGVGTPLGKYHLEFYATDMLVARQYMATLFPKWWCSVYTESDADASVLKFGTFPLQLPLGHLTSAEHPAKAADFGVDERDSVEVL